MEPSFEHLKATTQRVLRHYGVSRAGLYGSRVRGDHSRRSDLDIVVDHPRPFSLYDLIALQQKLSEALGIEAHVTTYGSLHPRMRDNRILVDDIEQAIGRI